MKRFTFLRWLLVTLLPTMAFSQPPAARPAGRGGDDQRLLTAWLDEANIHPPVTVGALTFFPVSAAKAAKLDNAWTLDEALAAKQLEIQELEPAQIEKARFVNKSNKHVLCLAGQVIEGGKQNRTLIRDALLGPDSSTVLDLYCVQKGRWEGGQAFEPKVSIAPQAVRNAAASAAGQQEVWNRVRSANEQMGVQREDEDLASALKDRRTTSWLEQRRKQVIEGLPRDCVGVIVARGMSFVGADLFNRAELFRPVRDNVIDSYLLSMDPRATELRTPPSRPTQEHCKEYIGRCYTARMAPMDTPDAGQLYRLSGDATGTVLGFKGSWMVHTHLVERIVPVEPPRPRPPRPEPRPEPIPEQQPEPRTR